MAGLMGSGKSFLARGLARRLGARLVRSDVVRKELLAIEPTKRHPDPFGQGIYTPDMTSRTYDRLLELAAAALREGESVIIDASFKDRLRRADASETACMLGADFFLIECVCPERIIKERLEARQADPDEPSDGRWELFLSQKAAFQPITELPSNLHVVVDTSQDVGLCLDRAARAIKGLAIR